ncbi:recombinase family protein [Bacillus cereus]|nr:recombinase family protein [Bacillus cereus]
MYKQMKQSLQSGDLLYVPSFYHFGRTQQTLVTEWEELTQYKQVEIIVLNFPLFHTLEQKPPHTNKLSLSDFMLDVLCYLAEEEQSDKYKRQQAGFAAARQKGVKIGRKKIEITDLFISAYQQWKQNKITAVEAMEQADMKPNTFYRRVREYESRLCKSDT